MTIIQNTPFTVRASHTPVGSDTASYRLLIDGAVVATKPVSALVAGSIAFDQPAGLPAGDHAIRVSAVGPGGESVSDPVTVQMVTTAPAAPTDVVVVDATVVAPPSNVTLG